MQTTTDIEICDIPKGRHMSTVRHFVAAKILCDGCMVSGEHFISGGTAGERSVRDAKMARTVF